MSYVIRPSGNQGKWEVDVIVSWPGRTKPFRSRRVVKLSRSKAEEWAKREERRVIELLQEAPRAAASTCPRFEVFAPRFIERHCVANGQKASGIAAKETAIARHLMPRFGHKRLDEISEKDISELKLALLPRVAKTTNNVLSVLSIMLKMAVRWGDLASVPVHIAPLRTVKKEMSFYNLEDYQRLLEAGRKLGPLFELLVRLGGDLGLRRGEMLGLSRADIDFTRGLAKIHNSVVMGIAGPTKGLRSRQVPLTAELRALLIGPLASTKGYLLGLDETTFRSPQKIRIMMRKVQAAAGLPDNGTLHVLRHTYCSHLAMSNLDVAKIQQLAGHSDLVTTLKYVHATREDDFQEAIDGLARLRSGAGKAKRGKAAGSGEEG